DRFIIVLGRAERPEALGRRLTRSSSSSFLLSGLPSGCWLASPFSDSSGSDGWDIAEPLHGSRKSLLPKPWGPRAGNRKLSSFHDMRPLSLNARKSRSKWPKEE